MDELVPGPPGNTRVKPLCLELQGSTFAKNTFSFSSDQLFTAANAIFSESAPRRWNFLARTVPIRTVPGFFVFVLSPALLEISERQRQGELQNPRVIFRGDNLTKAS